MRVSVWRYLLLDPDRGYGKQLLSLLGDGDRVGTCSSHLRGGKTAVLGKVAGLKIKRSLVREAAYFSTGLRPTRFERATFGVQTGIPPPNVL